MPHVTSTELKAPEEHRPKSKEKCQFYFTVRTIVLPSGEKY